MTAEIKKGRYVYYHCTGYRGKCALPYFREEDGNRLGQILKDIHIPDSVLEQLRSPCSTIRTARRRMANLRANGSGPGWRRYVAAASKPTSTSWTAKSQKHFGSEIVGMEPGGTTDSHGTRRVGASKPGEALGGVRILELANKAYFLYLKQPPAEKAKLLRIVLSNCKIDAASVDPTYRKPFDLIVQRVKKEEWLPGLDSN